MARVEAEPPRIDSIDDIVLSSLRKISALPKAISPNCKMGNPSSCNCRNFAPPAATGRPRTAIFALPSPPDDSERIPGIDLKASAELLGVVTSIWSADKLLTETLDAITVEPLPAAPVTTIRSKSKPFFSTAASSVISAALKLEHIAKVNVLNSNFLYVNCCIWSPHVAFIVCF